MRKQSCAGQNKTAEVESASAVFCLFPNVSVGVFAFEQFPFHETFKAEGSDVYGFGFAVEDELDQAGARGGGGLEAGAAQPAGQIETVGTCRAVDGALVGGQPVASHVDGLQAALFDLGNALDHIVDEFVKERRRGRLVIGIRQFLTQRIFFTGSQDERAAFGTEVAVDDVIDHCWDFSK